MFGSFIEIKWNQFHRHENALIISQPDSLLNLTIIAFGVPRLLHMVVRDVIDNGHMVHEVMEPEISPALTGKPYALGKKGSLYLVTQRNYRQMAAVGFIPKNTLKYITK